MAVLYILLFLVMLSLLIIIHELGHLTAAKIFKVYCLEFSCGMGPLLFKVKKKGWETQFSLRAIPFGGYVSMYGEGVELPAGETVEPERSLNGVAKWKRAIILVAGVSMNAILALIIFFISNIAFPIGLTYVNQIQVNEAAQTKYGLQTGEVIVMDDVEGSTSLFLIDKNAMVTYEDSSTRTGFALFNSGAIQNYDNLDYSQFIVLCGSQEKDGELVPDFTVSLLSSNVKKVTINFMTKYVEEGSEEILTQDHFIEFLTTTKEVVEEDQLKTITVLQDCGIGLYYDYNHMSFGDSVTKSFEDFGRGSTMIVNGLVTMITDTSSWNNVGGIVAIGFESTNILQNFGFGQFLQLWGIISVNLAIVNLLPFPGLDGWQLLVLIVEAITRKTIPEKVKNIVSFIGIGLLFVLMGVILIKDVFTYIFLCL